MTRIAQARKVHQNADASNAHPVQIRQTDKQADMFCNTGAAITKRQKWRQQELER